MVTEKDFFFSPTVIWVFFNNEFSELPYDLTFRPQIYNNTSFIRQFKWDWQYNLFFDS